MNLIVDFSNTEHIKIFDSVVTGSKSQFYIDKGWSYLIYNQQSGEIITAEIEGKIATTKTYVTKDNSTPITDILQ